MKPQPLHHQGGQVCICGIVFLFVNSLNKCNFRTPVCIKKILFVFANLPRSTYQNCFAEDQKIYEVSLQGLLKNVKGKSIGKNTILRNRCDCDRALRITLLIGQRNQFSKINLIAYVSEQCPLYKGLRPHSLTKT